ncbi:MAG: hypothetical protein KDB07_00420 [Planctomycetes bacterium]|nr:hypothetical protein [Planctomycetota bacterium]
MQSNISKSGGVLRVVSGVAVLLAGLSICLDWPYTIQLEIIMRIMVGVIVILVGGFMIFEGLTCW